MLSCRSVRGHITIKTIGCNQLIAQMTYWFVFFFLWEVRVSREVGRQGSGKRSASNVALVLCISYRVRFHGSHLLRIKTLTKCNGTSRRRPTNTPPHTLWASPWLLHFALSRHGWPCSGEEVPGALHLENYQLWLIDARDKSPKCIPQIRAVHQKEECQYLVLN